MKTFLTSVLFAGICFSQTADTERLHRLQEETVRLCQEGRYTEALPVAEFAVELAERVLGPDPETSVSLNNLAAVYAGQGQYSRAEPLYLRSLAIREKLLGAQDPETAEALNNLAGLYSRQGQYAKAEPLYQRALAIRKKVLGAEDPDTAITMNNLGALYEHQGQYAKAEPLYLQVLAIRKKVLGAQDPATANSANNLAELYRDQGQYAKAEPLYLQSLAIYEKVLGAQNPTTAISLDNLAELYREQGQYAKAEPLYRRSLSIYEKVLGMQHPETAIPLNNLALLYEAQGQYAKAEPLYLRSLAIREKAFGAQHPETANSLNNLAELYKSQGQYARAEPLYLRALAIREEVLGAQHPETANSLNNLAELYASQGQYAKAEPLYLRSLVIREKVLGVKHPGTAASLNNLAELYEHQKRYAEAEPFYLLSLAIRERVLGAQHPETADSLNNLAGLFEDQGQYAKAEPLYLRSLAIREKVLGPQHPSTAASLNNLAELYVEQGQYAKAEPLYLQSLSIYENALDTQHVDGATPRENLLLLYLDTGAQDKAQRVLKEGWSSQLKYLERSLSFADETWRRKSLVHSNTQLALLLAVQGNARAIRALGLNSVLASKGRVFEDTVTALLTLRSRLPTNLQQKLDELIVIRREEAGLVAQRTAAEQARMKDLNAQDDQLSEALSQQSSQFRTLAQSPKLEDISAQLKTGALVELVNYNELYAPKRGDKQWGPARYGAYLLTADSEVRWIDLGPTSAIDVLAQFYRAAMNSSANAARARLTAREIDKLTLEPIRKALPGVTEFYVAADGQLRLVPWAALRDEKNDLLIEKYKIHTLLTGRDLVRGAPLASNQAPWVGGLEAFGNVDGKTKFPALPGAMVEARAVADVMKPRAQMLDADQMTKSFLLEKIDGPRVLHLATHGYYQEAHGGLALKDGNLSDENVLTDSDVAKLKLFGTQLVVLSACSTGLGEVSFADGITGLQRSLTLAGARSQILTLWPVSDAKTKELMVAFYRNLFEKGMTKAEALRQAQLEMSRQGVSEYYWAPFVLYGDGGMLGQ